jgi:hypothetical protein
MANQTKSKHGLTGAFDLFPKSAQIVRSNFGTFAIIYIIPLLSNLGALRGNGEVDTEKWSNFTNGFSGLPGYAIGGLIGFGIILFILFFLVYLVVNAMKYALELESAKGKKPGLEQLWPFAKKYWLRLFGLMIVVGLTIVLGFVLLIVPGIIALRRYFLSAYVMIDKDLSIPDAMKESARISKLHSGYVYSIIGVMILISLPSAIPVFGWAITFVLAFLYSVAPALRYEELKKLSA